MPDLKLFVIIPTHGRAPLLGRTLASLSECDLPECYEETIVIENGSKAGAESVVAAADARLRSRYMHVGIANKSNALNEAVNTLPESAFIVFFDDDVRFAPGAIAAYAESATQNGLGHYFGGPLEVDYEARPPEHIRRRLPPSAKGWKIKSGQAAPDTEFLGANWAVRAKDLAQVGGFNTDVGPGMPRTGRESEMQWRLRKVGVRPVYVKDALIWHYVPKERCTVEWLRNRAQRMGSSRGHLRRHTGGIRLKSIGYVTFHFARAVLHHFRQIRKPIEHRLESELDLIEQTANLKSYFRG